MAKKPSNNDGPQPMDSSAPERKSGEVATNNQRVCYALVTLNNEVNDLFPGGPIPTFDHPDGRNTMLAVEYDTSMMDEDDRIDFTALMSLLKDGVRTDRRLESVTIDDVEQMVYVEMRSSLRTQDDRTEFGLAKALHVLSGDPEPLDETDDDIEGSL